MGLGSAMAGGNPREGREVDDFYPTPWAVTRALMREVNFGIGPILEPAAGNYAMATEIERAGYEVTAIDLMPRDPRVIPGDFFDLRVSDCPTIITNPPFKLAAKFIEHSLDVLKADNLALLLKSTFWHAASRSGLFERHPPSCVYALTWRPDFMDRGGPTMDCSWFVWSWGDRTTKYKLLHKPEA